MNNNENKFNYTYSAKEQAELKKIREKYLNENKPQELSKIEQIKKLDKSVTQRATVISLTLGTISTLIMGLGMSIIMTDISDILMLSQKITMILGIMIGFVGMIGVIFAYPLYHKIVDKTRKKIAPEILRLTDELINEK